MYTPNGIKTGAGLGLVGLILSFGYMAIYYDAATGQGMTLMGFCLLVGCLFLALAGGCMSNGTKQWGPNLFMVMAFFTIAAIVSAAIVGEFEVWFAIPLVLIAVCILICTSLPSSKKWFAAGSN